MKLKIIVIFIAILGVLVLAGCKPKPTTLAGQVFIVTQGADNVKLGNVEILLIEKSKATEFLQQKMLSIQESINSRQQALTNAEANAQKAQIEFDSFSKDDRPATNSEILKIKAEYYAAMKKHDDLEKQFYAVDALQSQASAQGWTSRANALYEREQSILEQEKQYLAVAESLTMKLKGFLELQKTEEKNKLETAKLSVVAAQINLENSPTAEDYLADFSPGVIQKTQSDADGRFSFSYLRDKPLAIYASAQRAILNKTEKYYWLVDAPTNAESVQVFLSNNNLVFVDPDGYFKLKPKPAR